MGKAYHAGRNRIGEYELEWLEPEELLSAMLGALSKRVLKSKNRMDTAKVKVMVSDRVKKMNEPEKMFNCVYCRLRLDGKDKSSFFTVSELGTASGSASHSASGSLGTMMNIKIYNSLYEASNDTGISLNALWNAREKGNRLVVRRRDKVPFQIS